MLPPGDAGDVSGERTVKVLSSQGEGHWLATGLHMKVQLPSVLEPPPTVLTCGARRFVYIPGILFS